MKSKLFMAAVALALPVAARAGDTGPELAFRTGFSFPFGHFTGAPPGSSPVAVSDLFHGFVPLGVEAGFRFTPDVYAGLVFQYAIGLWNGCPSNLSCSGHDVGLGFDVRYHPLPGRQVDPWFGIGAGYEWISFAQSQPGFSSDTGLNGFELLHLDVGADLVASPNLRVGSFLEFKLGRYRNLDAASGGPSTSTGITNKALHEFLTLGFRFSFLP
jgi:hypothetical protein